MASVVPLTSSDRLGLLLEAVNVLTRELDLDRLLPLIMDRASRVMQAERSTVFVVDQRRRELWSRVAQGVELREIRVPFGQGLVGAVAVSGETINVADAYTDARFNPEVDRQTGYRTQTLLSMPVRDASGQVVAVLQVLNKVGGAFTAEDEALLHAFADQVAIALRNADQISQLERRRRTSEILLDVMKSFSAELDVDQLLIKIMARTSEVMNAERSTLFLVGPERNELWSKVAQGSGVVEIRIPLGHGIAGEVARTGETINIADAYQDPRFDRATDDRTGYHTRTILCAPVRNAERQVVGVVQVLNKHEARFGPEDEELLSALAAQAFIALDNARLFETVLRMKNFNESILACMATGVLTVDNSGRVSSVNPSLQRMFELPADGATGRLVGELLDDTRNAAIVSRFAACMGEGARHDAYDVQYRLPSGDAVSVNLSVVPLLDRKRRSRGAVLVADDITQEQRLMSTLCRYVTREVAEHVLKDKERIKLGGSRQQVSILFADIRDFTTISERYDPETIVALLNDYFSLMVHEVFAQQGTLDKFIGDAVMAVFGVPISRGNDAVRAVRAALGMRRALRHFNERQAAQGKLTIESGIGIGHGEAISGNVGSDQRMEYTVIGDPVNVASRLEGLTKSFPYKILINEATFALVRDDFPCVLLGEARVKGKGEPVRIYGIPDPED